MIIDNGNFNIALSVKTMKQYFAIPEENSHHGQNSASGFFKYSVPP